MHAICMTIHTLVVQGHPTPFQTAVTLVCVLLLLVIAYKIGQVILRLLAGLLFMGLLAYGIWYLFIR